jgi:hypothetical protein
MAMSDEKILESNDMCDPILSNAKTCPRDSEGSEAGAFI